MGTQVVNPRVALIAGASGVVGYNLTEHLVAQPDWRTVALVRTGEDVPGAHMIRADLLDRDAMMTIDGLGQITHLFFPAYRFDPDSKAEYEKNVAMLQNMLDALHRAGAPLQHVVLFQGMKAYGASIGPYRTPARESDPRILTNLFYYGQEDLARELGRERGFRFTALRPTRIFGIGFGNFANLLQSVAIYASLCKELGYPLVFPGSRKAFGVLLEMTDTKLLAKASVWACDSPSAADEVFNVTNGDLFRWNQLWPLVAEFLGLQEGDPMPLDLKDSLADKSPIWQAMVRRHGLVEIPYERLVNWDFASSSFRNETEAHSSTVKIRRAGFHDCLDTPQNFLARLHEMRERRLIP